MFLDGLVPDAPETVLYIFACDCAQRALLRERAAGIEPDERLWKALALRRRWIGGEESEEALDAAKDAIWELPMTIARRAVSSALRHPPRNAARSAAWDVARGTGSSTGFERERLWQVARLRWLLDVYAFAGDRLPWLLRDGQLPIPEHVRL